MAGRRGNIRYLESTRENGFVPELPTAPVDLICLCFPNNPTGAVWTSEDIDQLREIVAGTDEQKAAARERFRFYRDRGYQMNTHNL